MRLDELLAGVEGVAVSGARALEVTGLAWDSRRVRPGDVFFALPGLKHDGTAFVPEALERGAVAVVAAGPVEAPGRAVVVAAEPRLALAQIASRYHGDPSAALEIVGVTGTNGKTTITWMLESIFRAAGRSTGVIGTTGVRMAGETRSLAFTTPEAPELQGLLAEMRDDGVRSVAMEVSSHALVQRRSYGLHVDVAVFTNLTQDHLDFHGTMDAYLDAKLMLFDGRNGRTGKRGVAVINVDDPSAGRVADAARRGEMRVLRVGSAIGGTRPAAERGLSLEHLESRPDGLALTFGLPASGNVSLTLPLWGRYNGINAALACGAALALGIDDRAIVRGLETMPAVPGRLERVDAGQPFAVLVDYAHTPDALERAFDAVREHVGGRVLVVFGCGGDRDRGKRPIMGGIAAAKADLAWITSDNPRSEDPERIAGEVAAGDPAGRLRTILDRREAIAAALDEAHAGDAVLVAGKGHETTQTVGDRVLPFDDREVARELLRGRAGAGR